MKLTEKLKENTNLTPAERNILRYIDEHQDEVIGMSVQELADELYVSPSTINRFCKKIGISGHKELLIMLAKDLSVETTEESSNRLSIAEGDDEMMITSKVRRVLYAANQETFNQININTLSYIAGKISDAGSVVIYVSPNHEYLVKGFAQAFVRCGIRCALYSTALEAAFSSALSQPTDVPALMIAYDAEDPRLEQLAGIFKDRKVNMHLITGPLDMKLRRMARTFVQVEYFETDPVLFFGREAALHAVLSVLYAMLFHQRFEENTAVLNRMREYTGSEM